MTPALQTAFLQSLGYALINSLWQFALLWLVYVFLTTVFKFSSHQKYVTGVVLQFAGFAWFITTVVAYSSQLPVVTQLTTTSTTGSFAHAASFKEKLLLLISGSKQLLPFLSVAYIV